VVLKDGAELGDEPLIVLKLLIASWSSNLDFIFFRVLQEGCHQRW
jgi:hypothetical protein